jgi:hypothetical protein
MDSYLSNAFLIYTGGHMEYPEKNSIEFCVGAIRFFLNDRGELWNAGKCFYEWRQPGERTWTEESGYGYLPVGKDTFEIREIGKKVYYRVDRNGYERFEEKSLAEMIEEIVEKVDFIEQRKQVVYALLPDGAVTVGCIDSIKVLEDAKLIQEIHCFNGRSLYLVLKNKIDEKHFMDHKKRVEDLYERIVRGVFYQ